MQRPAVAGAAQDVPLGAMFAVLWRRKLLVVLIALAVATPLLAAIWRMPSYYRAEASVMVDPRKTEFSDLQASSSDVTGDTLTLRTQTDLLNSDQIALSVVDQLDLVARPEFQALLHSVSWRERAVQFITRQIGEQAPPAPAPTAAQLRQIAAGWAQGLVLVVNDGRSYTISVRADTTDPALSAEIANAYVTQYLNFLRGLKISVLSRAHSVLDEQLASLQERVRRAEQAVETYREAHGLIISRADPGQPGDAATVAGQQLSLVNTQLATAQATLSEKMSHLRAAQAALRAGDGYDAVPEVLASALVQRLRADIADANSRLASLSQSAMEDNPAVRSAHAALETLRQHLAAEVGKIVSSLQSEVRAAQAQVESLQAGLGGAQHTVTGQSAAQVRLMELTSEADAARGVYRDFLVRYQQTTSQMALQEPDASIMSSAQPPLGPAGPARGRFGAIAVLAAVMVGALAALVAERLRGGLRTAEHLAAETGLFPLGLIPQAPRRRRRRLESRDSLYGAAVDQVQSLLRYSGERFRARSVLVTSAAPGEGKTFFAISLAASVGRQGGQALLVDADLRRPGVAKTLRRSSRTPAPVTELGSTRVSLQKQMLPGVDVMTILPGAASQAGIAGRVGPGDLEAVLQVAREHYDLVVVDTPPVLAIPDASTLVRTVDGVLMVVRWRATPVVTVNAALRTLSAYGARVLGGVLTQVRIEALDKSEGGQAYVYRSAAKYYG